MKRALRAEWTKLRTDPGNIWLLIGTVDDTAPTAA